MLANISKRQKKKFTRLHSVQIVLSLNAVERRNNEEIIYF